MNTLQVYDPFAESGLDEIFRGFFKPVRAPRGTAAAVKVDVTEKGNNYLVHAEIPGVGKDDIHVTIDGNQVAISAEVKRESEVKDGERLLRSERYHGAVYRSFVAGRDRRGHEPGSLRKRRARIDADQEGPGCWAQAHHTVTRNGQGASASGGGADGLRRRRAAVA